MAWRCAVRTGLLALLLGATASCASPRQHGEPVSHDQFAHAEAACREEAVSRYGPPPARSARRDHDTCDAQSWLCRRTQAWMLNESNPLSTATTRDRMIHQHTQRCLERLGFDPH